MFCSRCGLRVDEGAGFCGACGQPIGVSVVPMPALAGAPQSLATPTYAGFWIRVGAHLIDGMILGIPAVFLLMIMGVFTGGFGMILRRRAQDPAMVTGSLAGPLILLYLGVIPLMVAAQWLYFAGMESSARQATLGKAAMSIRVADLQGNRITFRHATGRFFAKVISGLIPLGIGYIMAGFTEKKQALHDMVAKTLVLRKS